MDKRLVSLYLSRILSGQFIFVYDDTTYKLIYPDISVKYNAELYAQEEYEKNKYNEWITDEDLIHWLIDAGLWFYDGDKKLEELEKQIEDYKVELYNSVLNPNKIKSARRSLDQTRKQYNKFYSIRHSFDHITTSGYANLVKNQYIFANSIYDINNNKLFNNIADIDYNLLNSLLNFVNEHTIDISTFKYIARSEIWRNYWSANKERVFDKATIDWTDEQKTLVVLTKMYDSVHDHPECPTDSVIEDDDMLDGWMIIQRRENEKHKAKNRSEQILKDKKLGNAKEVFLVANSKEEVENIYNLNDPKSRNIIRERESFISKINQEVSEANLPDVKRDLVVQSNQQFMQNRKK